MIVNEKYFNLFSSYTTEELKKLAKISWYSKQFVLFPVCL